MMSAENESLKALRMLEEEHAVVEGFACFGSSSWVAIKNALFEESFGHLGAARLARGELLSRQGVGLIFQSLRHYLSMVFKRGRVVLFAGAGSGLFELSGNVRDAYLPTELRERTPASAPAVLYMLSATHVELLARHRRYLADQRVIIFSYLVSPLRELLAHVLLPAVRLNGRLIRKCREVSEYLRAHAIDVPPRQIAYQHARFAAGVMLYRLFLGPFRISTGFVVSAYSNSEICAVLRGRGVRIVEIQHGTIGRIHRGYNYAVQHSRLPTPDIVRVYDEFWRMELLDAGYFRDANIEVSRRLKYVLAESECREISFDYVVFTGQGICLAEVCEFVKAFAASAAAIHLVYVPHPNEGREYTEALRKAAAGCASVHLLTQRNCTTERLIIDGVAHISMFSSCHFDAIHYKGKTFILDVVPDNPMNYYALRRPDQFIVVGGARELLEKLEQK